MNELRWIDVLTWKTGCRVKERTGVETLGGKISSVILFTLVSLCLSFCDVLK